MEFKVCPNAVLKPVGSLTLLTDHKLVRTHTQNRKTCTSSVVNETQTAGGDEAPNDLPRHAFEKEFILVPS